MAKIQNLLVPYGKFDGFSVQSPWDFMADDPDDLVLCLVRAVLTSFEEDEAIQATGQNKKELSKNTISFWLCGVIKRA